MSQGQLPPRRGDGEGSGTSSDLKVQLAYDARKKSLLIAYLVWFFIGILGVHRIYLGRIKSGFALLALSILCFVFSIVTLGIGTLVFILPFIWLIVDAFLIPGMVERANMALANDLTRL